MLEFVGYFFLRSFGYGWIWGPRFKTPSEIGVDLFGNGSYCLEVGLFMILFGGIIFLFFPLISLSFFAICIILFSISFFISLNIMRQKKLPQMKEISPIKIIKAKKKMRII